MKLRCLHIVAIATGSVALAIVGGWVAWPERVPAHPPSDAPAPVMSSGTIPDASPAETPLASEPVNSGAPAAELPDVRAALVRASDSDWQADETRPILVGALVQWGESQPEAAIEWLDHIPADVRDPVQLEVAGAIMALRPHQAIELLSDLPPSVVADQMLRQAAMEYASANPAEALEWARSQPEDSTWELLLGAVLCAHAAHHPAEAAASLDELPECPQKEIVTVEIVQRWAQQDAPAAADFVSVLSGSTASSAAENLIIQWVPQDDEASHHWAKDQPDGAVRDAADAAWLRAMTQRLAAAN